MNYKPGEGYDKGYKCRMTGGQKPPHAVNPIEIYWKEYSAGWDDADVKILSEARERNACSKPKCCKKKDFIQD
jgi:hypothetical protein